MGKTAVVNPLTIENADMFKSKIAMSILLISWSMFFATLFLAYMLFRVTNAQWPPMGYERVPLNIPTVSTILVAFSSIAYWMFEKNAKKNSVLHSRHFLWLAFAAGLAFIFSQFSLWSEMENLGFYSKDGIFPSILYGFTWIHAAHMGMGILLFAYLILFSEKIAKKSALKQEILIKNIGLFWHFLGVVWVLLFIGMFVF